MEMSINLKATVVAIVAVVASATSTTTKSASLRLTQIFRQLFQNAILQII